jgi:uncharacterized damage-inducible protein DinB
MTPRMPDTNTENYTLAMFYTSWKEYQDRLRDSIAPLTADQLDLQAAPGLRSIGANAAHIIGCRAGWFTYTMGEERTPELEVALRIDEPNAPPATAEELVKGLDITWQMMSDCLARWTPDDMKQKFPDDWDGETVELPRAWIVWHVLEHDLHHSGEISLTLGMHGIPAQFTS